ncbi:SH3 domain-containing protein [Devosia sp. XK-2]|uniref:SH3 domain-containing protein n=1 Tax=Devosia sp. XK-2 TaxID=3126689 RepID=UPI0030CD999D
MKAKQLLLAVAALAISATTAMANPGATTAAVNMRSGPGTQYQVIVAIPASQPVTIIGCISGSPWCDIVWADRRGWVSANYIYYYTTPATPVPVTTVYQRLPAAAPWVDARRDARVEYRVQRRWDRWLGGQ